MTFAPGLVGTFQDSDVGPERHAPAPRSGLLVSRSIGEPLANYPAQRQFSPLGIIHAERNSVIVPEIELGEVAMQVFLADMLIDAVDPAFEDREVSLGGIGGCIAAHVFLLRVVDSAVTGEPLASFPIHAALVSAQVRGNIDFGFKDRAQVRGSDLWDVVGADAAFAFDQSHDGFLGRRFSIGAVSSPAADEGFVRLNEFAFAAEWSPLVNAKIHHRFAEAMRQKPCGLQGDAEHAVQLVAARALLAGAEQVHCLEPDMQLDMARLENSADLDGEGLAAGIALVDTDAGAFAVQRPRAIDNTAVRAWPAIGPQPRFDEPISGFFAMEMIGGKDGRHGASP
jgi:hypothetical protein